MVAARRLTHPMVASAGLFILGQAVLIALSPLSRATTADSILGGAVFLSPDSYGYLANGASWSGVAAETWNRWGFLAIIRLGEYLGSGAAALVLLQAALITVAGAALVDLGRRYAGGLGGIIAASILLLNPMVSQWVRFVHTEAVFYALVVLALWAGERTLARNGRLLPLLALAVAVSTVRPNGILVGAACLTTLVLGRVKHPLRGPALVAVWGVAVGALVLGLDDATPRYGWDTAAYTVEGVVIEGADHASTSIAMPEPRVPIGSNRDLIAYAIDHPVAVGRLAIARILTETVQVRRHYPTIINIAVGLFMIGYLASAVVGFLVLRREVLTKAALLVAVPLALLIGGTFAVAEGRFGWAYLVALAVHVGVGATRVLEAVRALYMRIGGPVSP